MKLLVDGRLLHGGGIGRYVREVSRRWLEEPSLDVVRFLGDPEELETWLSEADSRGIADIAEFSFPPYSPRAQISWARNAGRLGRDFDVAFFPHYDVPLIRHPHPSLVVVHDLTQYLLPATFPWTKRVAGRFLLDGALGTADRVVTVSRSSRGDLERWRPELGGRIEVVYPGVSEHFAPADKGEAEAGMEATAELRPFLLMVGSSRPHKNVALGAEILANLSRRLVGGDGLTEDPRRNLKLVMVGPVEERPSPLVRAARTHGVEDRVVELGRVDDERLRTLYRAAEAFVFPSLYEGFGLPPLEAMACGTPVLASDRGSLPEVLGEHAVLLDPTRPEPWVDGLEAVFEERRTARRARIEHARSFSWSRTAEELLDRLRELT